MDFVKSSQAFSIYVIRLLLAKCKRAPCNAPYPLFLSHSRSLSASFFHVGNRASMCVCARIFLALIEILSSIVCSSIVVIVRMPSLCSCNVHRALYACICECIIFQLFLKMDSAVAVAVTVDVIHVFNTKLGFSHHFPTNRPMTLYVPKCTCILDVARIAIFHKYHPFSAQYIFDRRTFEYETTSPKIGASERQLHTGNLFNVHNSPFIHTCASPHSPNYFHSVWPLASSLHKYIRMYIESLSHAQIFLFIIWQHTTKKKHTAPCTLCLIHRVFSSNILPTN